MWFSKCNNEIHINSSWRGSRLILRKKAITFIASRKTTRVQMHANGRSYRYGEAVDCLHRVSRLSVVGRSRPLTAASRANIGVESARVRNVTERRHTTGMYVCADTDPRRRRHVGTRTRALDALPCVPRRDATPRVVPAISTLLYIRDTSRACKLLARGNGCRYDQLQ